MKVEGGEFRREEQTEEEEEEEVHGERFAKHTRQDKLSLSQAQASQP